MRIGDNPACHLTYCTNIHPGETWPEIRDNLRRYLPAIKKEVAPTERFGVGLRLSANAARALQAEAALGELRDILDANDLYVFTINGFPYGTFHGQRVKEEVYQPDWMNEERLVYTNLLADLLVDILPEDPALEGSISTVPGTFKPLAKSPSAAHQMTEMMVRHVAHLVRLREITGRMISLALEPEPYCFLETIEETVAFFVGHLWSSTAVAKLSALTGLGEGDAADALRDHVGVCLDLCHAAVEFESPDACVFQLRDAGIKISKLQLSVGLRIENVNQDVRELLQPFNDPVYLHQVVERTGDGLTRYLDLPQAFDALDALGAREASREWRVHFHVPLFLSDLENFGTTQPFLSRVLELHREEAVSPHLEVETYTWDVLPKTYRDMPIETAIARELNWVIEHLKP